MIASVEFIQVSKRYNIGQNVQRFGSILSRWRQKEERAHHWAVRNVSFELCPGESLGIIGPNGAGKTTILKLLSRVTFPTEGYVKINGRFSSLIELGAGFHPELTGRENIFLNGTILGMGRHEIKKRFDEIVDFAGIEKYLDTPVKRYSSGMYARLGFSVAAHVDPDVMLVDEVLAVGDMAFQQKCYNHMQYLLGQGKTMVFISHNLQAIQKVCQRCIVMYQGQNVFEGTSVDATAKYSNILRQAAAQHRQLDLIEKGLSQQIMSQEAVIEHVQMLNGSDKPSLTFTSGEKATVRAQVKFQKAAPSPVFACRIQKPDGEVVYDYTTIWANNPAPDFAADSWAEVEFPLKLNLVAGTYQLGVNIAYNDLTRYYDRLDRALDFVVSGGSGARGSANLCGEFHVTKTGIL